MSKNIMHKVVAVAQATDYLCWEACARMVFLWKNPTKGNEYASLVRPWIAKCKDRASGLSRVELAVVYVKTLGMKVHPKPQDVIDKSPLIWVHSLNEGKHASVLAGFDPRSGFLSINPGSTLNFEEGEALSPGQGQSKVGGVKNLGLSQSYISERVFEKIYGGRVWYMP